MHQSEWLKASPWAKNVKKWSAFWKKKIHEYFIQQNDLTDTTSSSSVSDAEEDQQEDEQSLEQSLDESLNEPEVSLLWDWDSKVPRGMLINHVPVTAVALSTFNERVAYFSTEKFPTHWSRLETCVKFYIVTIWRNQMESATTRKLYRHEQSYLLFLVIYFHL